MKDPCRQQTIERYLDGELVGGARTEVERHLRQCSRCAGALYDLQRQAALIREQLDSAAEQADFSGFNEAVFSKLAASSRASFWERLRERWQGSMIPVLRWAPAAAVLLIVVIWTAPMLIDLNKNRSSTVPPKPIQPQTAALSPGTGNEVVIKSMKYSGQRSMIFTVSPRNTTVIWLVDFDKASRAKTKEERQ